MGRKLLRILRHAVTMVGRNLRSYAMLSVTIVISFSLLLGFLTLMDSNHYSDYKERFALDRNIVTAKGTSLSGQISQPMVELMAEKASEYGNTHTTQLLQGIMRLKFDGLKLETGERLQFNNSVRVWSVPRQGWYLSIGYDPIPVRWLDGKERTNYDLESGEILMEEQLYYALGLDEGDHTIELDLYANSASDEHVLTKRFTVVGTVNSGWTVELEEVKTESTEEKIIKVSEEEEPFLVFSLEDINPAVSPNSAWWRTVAFYTDAPELIKEMVNAMDSSLYVQAVYTSQNQALEKIQTEKGTKAMVAMILLLLLGINLYSSFDNALNDRKFEIGVKRAVGASAFSIVRQFFYEGLLVMIVDILLSVAIVTDVAIVYKVIKESIPDEFGNFEHYVLYISPYSIAIFIICAVVLTVVFSFVFAYKSTQVQIVDYLKAE